MISEKLKPLLNAMVKVGASDLHLRPESRPIMRVSGRLGMLKDAPELNEEDMYGIAYDLFNDDQKKIYEEKCEADLSFSLEDKGRFRANVFQQRGHINIVMRHVPSEIKNFEQLYLPESLRNVASFNRGLILVTGTTGSGKSTTLAAIIDYINRSFSRHIITIEDPIEFVHKDIKSIISQRELGIDTYSYTDALKHIVRQDPDVILIGEMRDMETMSAALTAAQTGHLVLSTTHTIDAMQTLNRIVDVFPPHQQNQIRLQLADTIKAVVSQRLLTRKEQKGMVPAVEVLIVTALIRNLIEDNKLSSIMEHMEKGDYYGMQTFNQALEKIYRDGKIDIEEAKRAATNPEDLMLRLRGIKSGSGETG